MIDEAFARGTNVVLPRYLPDADLYEPCLIQRDVRSLAPGRFRIPEPTAGCPVFDAKQLDLALIPGIGFSLDGGRLGRGKGYYDRLLAEVAGLKCGVGFDCQVTAALPVETHDVRLNCILTPTRWHLVSSQTRP
jgi:5-formyltetrahydrofolate cyclo-ligase